MTHPLSQDATEFLERSKALLDAGDIRGWVQLMADDEDKMLEQYGFGNPRPFRMILAELDKRHDYIDRMSRFYIENPKWVALVEEARGNV